MSDRCYSPGLATHRPGTQSATPNRRYLNVLIASPYPINGRWPNIHFEQGIIRPLLRQLHGVDEVNYKYYDSERAEDFTSPTGVSGQSVEAWAAELCQWANLLILLPWDSDNIARMLHGIAAENVWLTVLRSWDVTKKILLVPCMNTLMWENPITKKQLSKLKRKWNWVRVIQPILWDAKSTKLAAWEGRDEVVEGVRIARDRMVIGQDVNIMPPTRAFEPAKGKREEFPMLPPELWSMILDFTQDWELAKALGVHTTLPVPVEWRQASSEAGPQTLMQKLEWSILCGRLEDVKAVLQNVQSPRGLSRLCIKLVMRFSKTALLSYLETNHKDLFWETFGHTFLPDKASAVFGNTRLLSFWHTSPSFLVKEYTAEALDGASRNGFVHVLDWWYRSGLPLKYTEAALEQASSQGRIEVLEWWKHAAQPPDGEHLSTPSSSTTRPLSTPASGPTPTPTIRLRAQRPPAIKLKQGKSISHATQSGSLPVVRWWAESGILSPQHEDSVAKLASTHGHVHLLHYWAELRGEKMVFDHQVLVGATKMGHGEVLEWWKQSGLKVEYKTCDIEEALEDGVEGARGDAVRRWWARNGLNLGVGTSEWMRVKTLGQG
ncbi:hypothetical protein EJ05DRAFT_113285 [Pseudovirgaria hyperparasitica]|uniref:Flavoprotein domain-containing protein n=1 Tax=Pseudovirgaria hyperparasitica TaxID=470096 RepID=A0A6A6VYK9_9PEZI|nr:uncharacterized protein EJ05DRAFT_113285 [Pseudovirgaria hyperparasitica]KAF2755722.1 hypothetical protein EJ05DRAFT_113285 [Pseudovirgaria hyperparasitica]